MPGAYSLSRFFHYQYLSVHFPLYEAQNFWHDYLSVVVNGIRRERQETHEAATERSLHALVVQRHERRVHFLLQL